MTWVTKPVELCDDCETSYLTWNCHNQAAEAEAAREARAKVKTETFHFLFILFYLKPLGYRRRGRTKSLKISG